MVECCFDLFVVLDVVVFDDVDCVVFVGFMV